MNGFPPGEDALANSGKEAYNPTQEKKNGAEAGKGVIRMKKDSSFDLYEISAARPHLLGAATLWVALFHSYSLNFLDSDLLNRLRVSGLLNRLKATGNCGVDLFLFLSGLGLYFSLSSLYEKEKRPVRVFYRRRLVRILPPVLLVSVLYYGMAGASGFTDWLGRVTLTGFFFPAQEDAGYWYFSLLLVLYLLFPPVFRVIRKLGGAGAALMIAAAAAGALLIRFLAPGYFARREIMLTRVPVFLLGAWAGKLCMSHVRIPRIIPVLAVPLAAAGLLIIPSVSFPETFAVRWVYALWTVPLVLSHALLCSLLRRKGFLYRSVVLTGTFSMEIYLIYENLYREGEAFFRSSDPAGITYAVTAFAAALVLAVLLKAVIRALGDAYRGAGK